MNEKEKARVLEQFEEGELSEEQVRDRLGDRDFERAKKLAEDTESALDADTSQYILTE